MEVAGLLTRDRAEESRREIVLLLTSRAGGWLAGCVTSGARHWARCSGP